MHHNCTSHVVVDRHQIAVRIAALAARMADDYLRLGTGYFKLNQDYVDRALSADDKGMPPPPKEDLVLQEPILLICVLKGSIIFTADLARALCDAGIATEIEFMKLSSYEGGTKSTGKVTITGGPIDAVLEKCVNRHVVIVEDILDTGRTLTLLIDMIGERQKAKGSALKSSIKSCVMLDKPDGREASLKHMKADYVCFTIPKEFVVGYGLDFNQSLRDLPDISVFKQDFYIEPVELRKIRRQNKL
eukprot:TRINITY_DN61445_c0_g1_i1.p1 TRINITY_DN61445_c0_g1~~TRINITY_DN61445_c0_g1_i1.p1  ORF type:complete len:246 (+),score=50.56 TRINITY_DN61445_c0_g1_i1:268-1005(+)